MLPVFSTVTAETVCKKKKRFSTCANCINTLKQMKVTYLSGSIFDVKKLTFCSQFAMLTNVCVIF